MTDNTTMYPNGIFVAKRGKLMLEKSSHTNPALANALQSMLQEWGFQLDKHTLAVVATLSADSIGNLYRELFQHIARTSGFDLEFKPLKPASLPLPVPDNVHLQTITLGSVNEFNEIFTTLVASPIPLGYGDKEIVEWFISYYHEAILAYLPSRVVQRDNIALLLRAAARKTSTLSSLISSLVKTPQDVLRTFEALSQSIPTARRGKIRFPTIPRAARRSILSVLEGHPELTAHMATHREIWKRIGEKLHPREYAERYPRAASAFAQIREGTKIPHFRNKLEQAFSRRETAAALELLKQRPGELARQLDRCLCALPETQQVLTAFSSVMPRIPTPTLLGLWEYYLNRNSGSSRAIMLKHSPVVKFLPQKAPLPEAQPPQVINLIREEFRKRFAKHPSLGTCYLDPALKDFTVPYNNRHGSTSNLSLPPGSRLPFNLPALRLFIWWQEAKNDRTDIDLSACLLDENLQWKSDLSYYNLHSNWGFHSGDITSAPEGACEFVDVQVDQLQGRYLVMGIYSFTGQKFSTLPKCLAGWQSHREAHAKPTQLGKADQIIQVQAASTTMIPMVLDIVTRQIVWLDLSLHGRTSLHNAFSSKGKLAEICRHIVSRKHVSLYDFLELHVSSRGTLTTDCQTAQTVFSKEKTAAKDSKTYSPLNLEALIKDFLL